MTDILPIDREKLTEEPKLELKIIEEVDEDEQSAEEEETTPSQEELFEKPPKKKPKQIFIGIKDVYDKGGEYEYLLNKHGLTGEAIAKKVMQEFN